MCPLIELSCSHTHNSYRTLTPKARLIPLSPAFLTYLRSDGIILPPENPSPHSTRDNDADADSGIFSSAEDDEASDTDAEDDDPSQAWPEIHAAIRSTIAELGGSVVPKLNWSAPKDATWINAGNSMECRTPNDIYLLLKSSDFVTHDLEQAFDGCVDDTSSAAPSPNQTTRSPPASSTSPLLDSIPYTLILRKTVRAFNPSCEFRCFVRDRHLLCLCQRDLNHYDFLFPMISTLRSLVQKFFDEKMRDTFPDGSFVFDVYIPPAHGRVWLVDVNAWAPRTDPLLFSWLEVLMMERGGGVGDDGDDEEGGLGEVVRLRIGEFGGGDSHVGGGEGGEEVEEEEEEEEELPFLPEVRLVKKDDPEAYSFTSPQYSAHKLPKDVVDASRGEIEGEGGLREFMGRWRDIVARQDAEEH